MALTPGTRLGTFEITAQIGVGGMGEVYCATDSNLKRSVAIKVLPASVAGDADRLARFQREAEVLASLNHPHIAAIYGLEKTPDFTALVMELVEGEDLSQRIARGAIPIDEALPIAKQIAEALEAAHEQGIIHRDLKPANIKLKLRGTRPPHEDGRPGSSASTADLADCTVKVLDFGLAKALGPARDAESGRHVSSDLTNSPTLTTPALLTNAGMILGTAAYMSPEQARGATVDKRADLWAFGVVLWEMLTATRLFPGATVSDTLAAVLRAEPDWTTLPVSTPPPIRRLLRRCLEKDRKRRLADAADARLEIEEALTGPSGSDVTAGPAGARRRRSIAVAACVALLLGASVAGLTTWALTRPAAARVTTFTITPPPDEAFTTNASGWNLAISPDGTMIVYQGLSGSTTQLYLRATDQLVAKPIPGTERALVPFFSPDGTQIGFDVNSKIEKVAVAGGTPVVVCDVGGAAGETWGPGGTIVFARAGVGGGLFRVSDAGGTPEKFAAPDPKKGEADYRWPEILPDGQAVVFTIVPQVGGIAHAGIAVRSFKTGEQRMLVDGGSNPHYVSGHLVYGNADTLMAVPFDAGRLRTTGAPVQIQDSVLTKPGGAADFAVSVNGSLLYAPSLLNSPPSRFIWRGRDGKPATPAIADVLDGPRYPRLSPDGHRLAATVGASPGQIWVYDLTGAAQPLKLTFKNLNVVLTWTPDGKRVIFSSPGSVGPLELFSLAADGSVLEPQRIPTGDTAPEFVALSPDGNSLILAAATASTNAAPTGLDLWVMPADGSRKPVPWLQTQFGESEPSFSPNGRWLAYVSNQTGDSDIWVRPFPGPGAPARVSPSGGHDPVWSRDGKELFYQTGGAMMAVDVIGSDTAATRLGTPTMLFEGGFRPWFLNFPRSYDVAPDGRFLMVEPGASTVSTSSFVVVLNWAETLTARMLAK